MDKSLSDKALIALAQAWFEKKGWAPFGFQYATWQAFLDGKNGLLNAPTGSGKTYALWIPIVLEVLKNKKLHGLKPGLKAIWITPLRALSAEIKQATEQVIADLSLAITVGVRTGDTSAATRAGQKEHMPDLLITTPESLHLLFASKGYTQQFSSCIAVVVDEWHELLGSKRGVQVELALSRLKSIAPSIRIWGISATIANLNQAQEVLLGPDSEAMKHAVLIQAKEQKKIQLHAVLPPVVDAYPWRGHMGLHLLDEVVKIIKKSKTTLLFTNVRSACELWYQELLAACPALAGEIAMHHGSIDKKMRQWVEEAIRAEKLKVVVCTSSLDLGVDFAPVETIIQVGGPKGVARFLQRAGRSNHRPTGESIVYFLATHAMELFEVAALQEAVKKVAVEQRIPYLNTWDVLLQYLTTLASSDGFMPQALYDEVRSTFCFQTMNKANWQWVINFLCRGGVSLGAYDEFKKLEKTATGHLVIANKQLALRHRLQIGTIVGDALMRVKYLGGIELGTIEEWFITKLIPGDVFVFAGKKLELYQIKDMEVLVKKAPSSMPAKPAAWMGGRLSFSSQMSELLRQALYAARSGAKSPEFAALKPLLYQQQKESIIPGPDELLIEKFKTREGHHLVFYPFEGYYVHEALASLLAYRISLLQPISFSIAFNDYGFELLSDQQVDLDQILDNNLFSPQHLQEDLQRAINATELSQRKFRDIAVIAGLVFTGYPGKNFKNKHLQGSSRLFFEVFREHEPDNLLLLQAYREVLEHQLEEGRLLEVLLRIEQQEITVKSCEKPTPFSFPIITDRLRERLSSESWANRIKKMTAQYVK